VKSKDNQCRKTKKEDYHDEERKYHVKQVCLNFRQLGEPYVQDFLSVYCEEIAPGLTMDPLAIRCTAPKIYLSPNGWYHSFSFLSLNLSDSPASQKFDQYVEVGKCAMIKP